MCLIVFRWQPASEFPLVLSANRDEFHARPAEAMGWWKDQPALLAGRDLQAGGTWLGVSREGRIATVTNFRDNVPAVREQSRGDIVTGFASASLSPAEYLSSLDGDRYAGFSALASDGRELAYHSNRSRATRKLPPGLYGLSNAALDTPWSKLVRSRARLDELLLAGQPTLDSLLELMTDRSPASDDELADPDLPFEIDRALSPPFIVMPDYGTRCSTALICRSDGHIEIAERRFDAEGEVTGESRFVFVAPAWLS